MGWGSCNPTRPRSEADRAGEKDKFKWSYLMVMMMMMVIR